MDTSLVNVPVKISRFVHLFQQDGVFCLQHSLTFEKVYGGKILQLLYEYFDNYRSPNDYSSCFPAEISKNIIDETIYYLYAKGLLIKDDDYDNLLHLSLTNDGCNRTPIIFLYLITTMDCNFRCKYCFIKSEGKNANEKLMSLNVAKNGLDVFAKLTQDNDAIPSVTYYGGEPMLNAEVVYASMKYIRELEEKKSFKHPVRMSTSY